MKFWQPENCVALSATFGIDNNVTCKNTKLLKMKYDTTQPGNSEKQFSLAHHQSKKEVCQ